MLKLLRWKLSIALVLMLLPAMAIGQKASEVGLPILTNYRPRNTGFSNQTWSILQDKRGVMYFGVGAGVFEFDGTSWRKTRISSNVARSLAQDANGKIWVGANADFGTLEPDSKGSLKMVSYLDKVPEEYRQFTDIWQILPTPKAIYLRSYQRLFRWDGQRMHVWSSKTRFEALSEIRGRIYTSQGGVGLQEIVGDELRDLPGGDAYKSAVKLFLHPYDSQRIVTTSRSGGLTLFDGVKATPFPTEADEYFKTNEIYVSAPLPDGGLCVTTLRGGAVLLERDGRLRRIIDREAGLTEAGVLTAQVDREGALWLGQGAGMTRVEIQSPISKFAGGTPNGIHRHDGSIYVAMAVAGVPLQKLVTDAKTGQATLRPIATKFNQAWRVLSFKDPEAKSPPQLLVSTSLGVMKVNGETISPLIESLQGANESTNFISVSRKTPNRIYISHQSGLSSMRWRRANGTMKAGCPIS